MRLELKNVGKIDYANIEINGITVIAGENNTGKSTISKMLFCLFSAFYQIDQQVPEERVDTLAHVLSNGLYEIDRRLIPHSVCKKLAGMFVECRDSILEIGSLSVNDLQKNFQKFGIVMDDEKKSEELSLFANRLYNILSYDDDAIHEAILQKRLNAEFAMKVGHLNKSDRKTDICLQVKDRSIKVSVIDNKTVQISDYLSLNKKIIYVDDPFVLDNLGNSTLYHPEYGLDHRSDLLRKLYEDKRVYDLSALDELVIKDRLSNIMNKIHTVCDGDLGVNAANTFVYKSDSLSDDLEIMNLSTGLKSFVILQRLLRNGSIGENGMLILDEPEIHLHPEWQLKFAEIIVLLQKEFNVNFLLNTHSPYFLNAIGVYTEKYGIAGKCKYYLTDEVDNMVSIEDVTENTEKIYAKLAKPLQILENLEYGDTRC